VANVLNDVVMHKLLFVLVAAQPGSYAFCLKQVSHLTCFCETYLQTGFALIAYVGGNCQRRECFGYILLACGFHGFHGFIFEFLIFSRIISAHSGQMPCEIGIPDFAEISSSAARRTGEVHQAHAMIRVKLSFCAFIGNL
jgi:hypothetical protein